MKPADVGIAVMVAVIWGLAFVASRIALNEFSPELMTTLRFAIAALPCLFVRKPGVSWPLLIAISSTLFLGQFLAQAFAIAHGVPVGLSSVIVQSQALFTIGFAALIFGELPTRTQTIGIAIATLGLLMICGTVGYDFSVAAFGIVMICPISFAIGNLLLRLAEERLRPQAQDEHAAGLRLLERAAALGAPDAPVHYMDAWLAACVNGELGVPPDPGLALKTVRRFCESGVDVKTCAPRLAQSTELAFALAEGCFAGGDVVAAVKWLNVCALLEHEGAKARLAAL